MLFDDLLITRSTTRYVQRMLYCHRHSHKIKKANQQNKTKQNKTRVNYPNMKFSTSTITTAFALVAVSGLCTIPTSVEAKPPKKNGKNEKNVVELKAGKNVVELKAMIDSDVFKGTVTVKQKQKQRKSNKGRQQITNAKWKIDIDEIDVDICKNACDNCDNPETMLNWHIHERAIPEDGSCGDAGGHWDPTFGCGGASQYQGEGDWCELLAPQIEGRALTQTSVITGRVNPQTCEPMEDITACEMGDLSSKMGQVEISEGRQRFSDEYISNLDNIKDLSIVFHCGGPRVACGNFELMD